MTIPDELPPPFRIAVPSRRPIAQLTPQPQNDCLVIDGVNRVYPSVEQGKVNQLRGYVFIVSLVQESEDGHDDHDHRPSGRKVSLSKWFLFEPLERIK